MTEQVLKAAIRAAYKAWSGAPPAQPTGRTPFAPDSLDMWALWQERAAIREYDAGLSRAEAERLTAADLGPCPAEPPAK